MRSRHAGPGDMDQWLTHAERDVVALVCEGLTNVQIAQRLSVSPRTVQSHLLKVFRKFGVSTRAELVARILRAQHDENAPSGSQGSNPATETFKAPDTNHVTKDRSTEEENR